jgi:hypothetical protein
MHHAWERIQYRVLVRKPEGKTPFGSLGIRWVDIKMYLKRNGEEEWIHIG